MASSRVASKILLLVILVVVSSMQLSSARLMKPQPDDDNSVLKYHNGAVLHGKVEVSIVWYGIFTSAQKSIIIDFIQSLTPKTKQPQPASPSVSQWWNKVNELYISKTKSKTKTKIILANQVSDEQCSLGKSLKLSDIPKLAAMASPQKNSITLVLTAEDVVMEGFGMSRCGHHGSDRKSKTTYIWVGNPATQCPGQCAWPFHQPIYGPQAPPLTAPNGDVGTAGMIITLSSLFAGTVTNPYGNGFYQGAKDAPLEAATACIGVYGTGAYPGNAGKLLLDQTTGASYNANGVNGRKYLVSALFDPWTSTCSTLV